MPKDDWPNADGAAVLPLPKEDWPNADGAAVLLAPKADWPNAEEPNGLDVAGVVLAVLPNAD